uniref:Secreted protein n=1 Tax=Parascaris equorum TaxID=6256 RepID=A0A914RX82_PAREQ
MNLLLPCFAHAAWMLKRHCGSERCGPYGGPENTILGYAHRCRVLICDMICTRSVLLRRCGLQK